MMAPTARAAFGFPALVATFLYVIDFPFGIFRTTLKTFSRNVISLTYRSPSLVFRPRRIGLGPTSRKLEAFARPSRGICNNRNSPQRPAIRCCRGISLFEGPSFPPMNRLLCEARVLSRIQGRHRTLFCLYLRWHTRNIPYRKLGSHFCGRATDRLPSAVCILRANLYPAPLFFHLCWSICSPR